MNANARIFCPRECLAGTVVAVGEMVRVQWDNGRVQSVPAALIKNTYTPGFLCTVAAANAFWPSAKPLA